MEDIQQTHIEEIIYQYGFYIYHFAFQLTTNQSDAEELTQETFIKAWQYLDTLDNIKAIKAWLRVICVNEFKMKLRKENKLKIDYTENIEDLEKESQYFITPSPLAIDEVIVSEEVEKLRNGCFLAMTRKLTINQRIAFSLVDMFGLSMEEAAQILNVTPKAVKGLLYRARMNLESFFKDHCSLLDAHNPCHCQAWIEFLQDRSKIQEKLRETLDYHEENYVYDEKTRQQILYYYQHMPDQRPSEEWFLKIISLIQKFYRNT